jgi:glycosyltransferase involved in cell wall biosynthesis
MRRPRAADASVRLLVFPRNDGPYQKLLYEQMRQLGVRVYYLGELTRSQTVNVFLLVIETVLWRIRGARLIHIHWVYVFLLPVASRFPVLRRATQLWFVLWLYICRLLAMRIVWTAHNVLPHEQVFADDAHARRALVKASALVVVHSSSALDELAAFGAVASNTTIIQHGPIGPTRPAGTLRVPGSDEGSRQFLFLGRVQEYKGVEGLLNSFAALPSHIDARLLVAGQCYDSALERRLHRLAEMNGERVDVRFEYIPDEEVTQLLSASDVVILPYRQITTSGSVMLALSHGRPLIVPRLPGLADLPDEAVCRYDGSNKGLTTAMIHLAEVDKGALEAMSAAAIKYSSSISWWEMAEIMLAQMDSLLCDKRHGTHSCSSMVSHGS